MDNVTDIQEKILDIYKEVKKICDKHNLRYYAIGGTCIGAVRHKGFIPWDDDLDIAMPAKDYKKFSEIAQKELPENMKVFYTSSLKHSLCPFMKVHDINTTLIEKLELPYPDSYKGICIDIMPLYGVPENNLKQKNYSKKIKWLLYFNRQSRVHISYYKRTIGKLMWLICKPMNMLLPYNFWFKEWEKLVSKYDFESSDYTGYTWSHNIYRLIFKKEWFNNHVELPFEDTTMRCPVGWDNYLTKQFGNYMELPPESEQINVHADGGIVDCSRPFSYYQKKNSGGSKK